MTKFRYLTCCVDISRDDVPALNAMIDEAADVSLATFRRHCDTAEWEEGLGYTRYGRGGGLSLTRDWHVSYWRSRFKGQPCYFAVHSAIEHIFVPVG